MNKTIGWVVVYCLFAMQVLAQERNHLLPEPARITYGKGTARLRDVSIYLPTGATTDVVFALQRLKTEIEQKTGNRVKLASGLAASSVRWTLKTKGQEIPGTNETTGRNSREAYKLTVANNTISIEAITSTGLFYAVQTLSQLIKGTGDRAFLPEVSIDDYPALPYRALMMDFAHGGLLTVQEIKKQLDFLARWKTNQYAFYNEVSIELDGYESINYRANYTKEEIRTIIAYGRERHIDVVPYVNFYGHIHELIRNEKHKVLGIGTYGQELDPRNPAVRDLLRNWIGQYTALFSSPFVHVGFDEAWETKRISAEQQLGLNGENLYIDQLTFVNDEFKKRGKTVLAWTDMTNFYPDIMAKFPKDVIPVVWQYDPDSSAIQQFLNPVLKYTSTFLIQPAVSGWGHIYPSAAHTYGNIDQCLKIGLQHQTRGFVNSLWTDNTEAFVRPSWLFTAYGSAVAWRGKPMETNTFLPAFVGQVFPANAKEMTQALQRLEEAENALENCLGKTQTGSIVESWSNPFSAYYLDNTKKHADDFSKARRASEEALDLLIPILRKSPPDPTYLSSLLVSAQLIHYTATRFLLARTITERWNEAMLVKKKDDFVFYDIAYTCHGLLYDVMYENGELKTAYENQWRSEYQPYRLNTLLSRFDVEAGFWRKLYLNFLDYNVTHKGVATQSFEELFKPDF